MYPKLLILISLLSLFCVSSTKSQPDVYVDPPDQIVFGQKTVTVNFRISNVTNVRTYGVLIKYDTAIIKFKSAIKGTFLNNNGAYSTFFGTQPSGTYIKDTVNVAESILGAGIAVSGSGLLFSVQFDILSVGQSPISIIALTLYDINNNLISGTITSGLVTVTGKVLVVDDDATLANKTFLSVKKNNELKSLLGASANLFKSSLTAAGYFVDQVNFSLMNTSNLINYDFIILSAGVKESDIFNDVTKRNCLVNYTLAGGKILVEGGNVGFIFRKEDPNDLDPEFRRNILLDSLWVSDRIGANLQIVNSNHPIFKVPNNISSPIVINNGGLTGAGARDEMSLLTKTGVSRVANWVGGSAENGGIIIYNTNGDTAKCSNIFFTFSIANFADQSLAGKLIVNAARYLMRDNKAAIKVLNLTVLVEGFYNGTTMVRDTVSVGIRGTTSPYIVIEDKKVLLDSLGNGTLFLTSVSDNTLYYLVIKHRNSIETWSAIGKTFSSGFLTYDFTTDSAKAYGNNMKKKESKWCIFSGDVNQDGFINSVDLSLIGSDAFLYSAGYKVTDINGDNFVDLNDLIICDDNYYKNIIRLTP